MNWIKALFSTSKPIIGMCHLMALPGDPMYDKNGDMEKIIDYALKDITMLQDGGVDAVLFSNEFSMPYQTTVEPITIAAMARIIGELKHAIKIPYGVDCLFDPIATIDLAAVTNAAFIREVMSGIYASELGLWNTDLGKTYRHLCNRGLTNLKVFNNVMPEFAKYIGERDIGEIITSTLFVSKPDALCVSGLTAGKKPGTELLIKIKDLGLDTLLFCNTGCTKDNIKEILKITDGVIVGTTFKVDGKFNNSIDIKRVKEFMSVAREN
ncbi:MAG: BtpA/SgcQ family protein [Defluviitaleaceae bacterium]|nr:BtpA/SgcQ family protein [Defluviitaleaceae bacterium]